MKIGGFHTPTPVHDPAVYVGKDDNYYIFGTHMAAAVSKDLRYWELFAQGVNARNPLFDNLFDDKQEAFSYCGKFEGKYYAVWAPDVSYNPYLKKYVMYFCTSGSYVKSCICMATADEVRGPYHFERILLYSGFDRETLAQTNVEASIGGDDAAIYLRKDGSYNNISWPNCIDPNLFHDKDGRLWMVYGSWSGGIFLIEIDEHTGLLIHPARDSKNQVDSYFGRKLLGGGHKSIEGPFILYDDIADYYYLFVSFGWLAREGGYQIRLFRSKKPEGPYVDMEGKTFRRVNHHDPYGLKLVGNYMFPSMEYGYKSPGHNSAFKDQDGHIYIVYHQRFDIKSEMHEPRVHQLFRTGNNWLTVCPFATDGEMLCPKDYQRSEVAGTFYVVEHGLDISGEMHKALRVELTRSGEILRYVEQSAVWERESCERAEEEARVQDTFSHGNTENPHASASEGSAKTLHASDSEGSTKALHASDSEGSTKALHASDLNVGLEGSHDEKVGKPEDMRTEENPYGSYTLNGDSRITFSLNGVSYEGVIVQLNDEAGNPTMCITGVGENQSAWAVKYL